MIRKLSLDSVTIVLMVALLTVTALAAGPLHFLDNYLNEVPHPLTRLGTAWYFLKFVPNEVGSRFIAIPLLGIVTLIFAYRHRSWRPIIVSSVGVLGMSGLIWGFKFLFARNQPREYDPAFFSDYGGLAFPSGHAGNVVLFYGLVLFLVTRYEPVRQHVVRRVVHLIIAMAIVQTAVSVYLQFHWFTDLVAGLIAGGLWLRIAIRTDQLIPEGRTRHWWPWREGDFVDRYIRPVLSGPPSNGALPPVVEGAPRPWTVLGSEAEPGRMPQDRAGENATSPPRGGHFVEASRPGQT
ncbi:undecaprenyl-diphosphatase [Haloechinothrix alba]|uniref:Undecaprenyl-diphosphatase n=1 Tax=Haloechinothrix alba TaxID=664784 RepID=A0A238Y6G5_9PSEU|nr:phosphatase PAP2 family protein [Haloechinothrix alba]SNR66866.1 undecaprenyl-diphosphatase [Haloechinothrix alba]